MRALTAICLALVIVGAGCTKETTTNTPIETAKYSGLSVPQQPPVFTDAGLPIAETEMNFDVSKNESKSVKYEKFKNSELNFTKYTHDQEWLGPATTSVHVEYMLLDSAIVGGAKFSQAVYNEVLSEVDNFRGTILSNSGVTFPTETSNYIGVTAEVIHANPQLIAVQITIGNYFAGAAHPNSYVRTINFDLGKARELTLDELFPNNTKYLNTIANLVRPKLVASLNAKDGSGVPITGNDEWLLKGTEPNALNYQNFLLTKTGLEILFDPYQVAAYALGPQSVVIPYSELKDLKPGLLAEYSL